MALFDAFLKLDGIKGESADAKHKGEIDCLDFSWGLQQTGTQAHGGGGGAGKVKFHEFSITKKTDSASPLLMLNSASGAHIKEATLTCRKAGGEQLEFLKIKLTDILISSYKPEASTDGMEAGTTGAFDLEAPPTPGVADEIPTESITINFSKIEVQYQAQGAEGKASGGPVVAGWDVKANKKV